MKICLYSPYIPDHTGGGEKYLLDVADVLSQKHQVTIAINRPLSVDQIAHIRTKYETFLNRSLATITFLPTPIGTPAGFLQKIIWTKQWDVFYYLTDGSLFWSLAAKNILHVQVPLKLDKSGIVEQLKLANWGIKNTNSEFTRSVIEQSWPTHIDLVHHPLVDLGIAEPFDPQKKQKIILSVGRFFTQLHAKRQDILVEMFKALREKHANKAKGWKLVLIGSVEDQDYADQVQHQAEGLPIEIHHSLSRTELIEWYQRASIYWHAAGFEVDELEHPEKVEHFGISTAEAMLAGAAPVVIGKGGQPEILGSDMREWLWQSQAECLDKTVTLLTLDTLRTRLQMQAHERAQVFGRQRFEQKVWSMLEP